MSEYLSLNSLLGHGPVIEGSGEVLKKIDEYLNHRKQREQSILDFLSTHPPFSSTWEITTSLYQDPKFSFFHLLSARANVVHTLEKLREEEKVHCLLGDVWWIDKIRGTIR